jgi:hypothetical protein
MRAQASSGPRTVHRAALGDTRREGCEATLRCIREFRERGVRDSA